MTPTLYRGSARTLTKDERETFFAFLEAQPRPARAAAIGHLSFAGWLRAMEIAGLRWRDVLDTHGAVSEWLTLRITKGGRGRVVPIAEGLRWYLDRLLHVEPPAPAPLDFVIQLQGRTNDLVHRSDCMQRFLRLWYRELGFHRCSSHSGRRTGATMAKFAGCDLDEIRRRLGHANIQTTLRYLEGDPVEARRIATVTDSPLPLFPRPRMAKASLRSPLTLIVDRGCRG